MLVTNQLYMTDSGQATKIRNYAWLRVLVIKLTSKELKKSIIIGNNDDINFNISVNGYKYMSALKDVCTIKISNLTYSEITQIITGKFFDIEVWCGYKKGNVFKIFEGGIIYISNDLNERKTNIVNILCASKLVAQFQQKRLALSINSGINIYSAYKYLCEKAGIKNSNVSESLKTKFLEQTFSGDNTLGGWLESLATDTMNVTSDPSITSMLSVYTSNNDNNRIINLNESSLDLTNGYPRLTSEGLTVTILPIFDFACGDIIKIDPSVINIGVSSQSEITKNYGAFLNPNGKYLVYQISYNLENRDSDFSLSMLCKSQSLISKIAGTNNG